jgi:hypothetical protein
MSDLKKDPANSPQPQGSKPGSEDSDALQRMEKIADEMAKKARDSEKRYDEEHDIFTK